jgi:methylenetetrahydrofolate dehydrogenase (NADP+)/methenyltetrahydrofolate cyclohydrolase
MDGKLVSKALLEKVREDLAALKTSHDVTPGLTVILAGDNPASQVYVTKKAKTARELGINSSVILFDNDVSEEVMLDTVDRLNADPAVHGILIQLPLPKHLPTQKILERVCPEKDVDGFHPVNLGRLMGGQMPVALPCTPAGVITLLDHYGIPLEGKHAVVIGRSTIVGKPVAHLLLHRNATVTLCHSRTQDLPAILRQADIVVAAVGVPNLVKGDDLKPGAVVIDVGINRVEGKLVGDVDYESCLGKAGYITPVPGGVGPMTIATLMANTVALCRASL